jgi:hypothetical protein
MSDSRADTLRRFVNIVAANLEDQYTVSDREMCDRLVKVCHTAQRLDDAYRKGSNNSVKTAQEALRYLANNPRPNGGEELYNAEHLLQIADELAK